jgi:hypothetical protein
VHGEHRSEPPQPAASGVDVPIEATATLPLVPTGRSGDSGQHPVVRKEMALPPGVALLIVHHGPNAGARFLLDLDVITAGRHPESDIFLDDVTVSRQHAEFRRTGSTYQIVDLSSLNGTYVNRQRVHDAVLESGNDVQIGKFRMTYRISG